VRFGFIQTEKATYPTRCCRCCCFLPGFYAWCGAAERRAREDAVLKGRGAAAHGASGKRTGVLASTPSSSR